MLRSSLLLILCVIAVQCAASLPPAPSRECQRISVGPGPEDMAVDRSVGAPRILISTHERRSWQPLGEIYALDPATQTARILPRSGEPADLSFRPHGIDISISAGISRLYVILHGEETNGPGHSVAVYRIEPERLVFETLLQSELLTSPNDLSVAPDGSIYVTNDMASRGSLLEMALRLRRSTVVRYNPGGEWSVAATELAFPNGILALDRVVYVSLTRGDALLAFPRSADGSLGEPRIVLAYKGLDNIMLDGQQLLVTAHLSDLAFLRHAGSSEVESPSVALHVEPESGVFEYAFADSGARISAAATALRLADRLYLSPVFEPFVLSCAL